MAIKDKPTIKTQLFKERIILKSFQEGPKQVEADETRMLSLIIQVKPRQTEKV